MDRFFFFLRDCGDHVHVVVLLEWAAVEPFFLDTYDDLPPQQVVFLSTGRVNFVWSLCVLVVWPLHLFFFLLVGLALVVVVPFFEFDVR